MSTLYVSNLQKAAEVEEIDEHTIFIAHSLGCIATLHFLTKKLKTQKIKQVVLVAGFNGRLGRLDEVNPFIDACKIDFDLLKRQIAHRVVIYSAGDDRVLPKFSLEQARSLDAKAIEA
ncbi:alpha/beta hydrolase, partial [Escherichia coli]|uniref:alpha/beta hydrolase n=1 Tax=Escherichia coli TaxID=562 RepID=UPI001BDBD826